MIQTSPTKYWTGCSVLYWKWHHALCQLSCYWCLLNALRLCVTKCMYEFRSVRRLAADLSNSLLQFLYWLHRQTETFMEAAITFLHPGCLELSHPCQDAIKLLLHLPLLLQFSLQRLSGIDLCFIGSLEVSKGWLQPSHLLCGVKWQRHSLSSYF